MHCRHGTKDIGLQLDNIKTMRKDMDRTATQMVNLKKEQKHDKFIMFTIINKL